MDEKDATGEMRESLVTELEFSSKINKHSPQIRFGIELGTEGMPDKGAPNKHEARTFHHYLSPCQAH